MTREIESYVWYDPFELAQEAEYKLAEAEYLRENVDVMLRAQHSAHMDNTYHLRRQLERLMEEAAHPLMIFQPGPIMVMK